MSVPKINPDLYVGNTGKKLSDILTNANNISTNASNIANNSTQISNLQGIINTLKSHNFKTASGINVNTYRFTDGLIYMYNPVNAPGANGFIFQISWNGESSAPDGYGCQIYWAYASNQPYFRAFWEGHYTDWRAL